MDNRTVFVSLREQGDYLIADREVDGAVALRDGAENNEACLATTSAGTRPNNLAPLRLLISVDCGRREDRGSRGQLPSQARHSLISD